MASGDRKNYLLSILWLDSSMSYKIGNLDGIRNRVLSSQKQQTSEQSQV